MFGLRIDYALDAQLVRRDQLLTRLSHNKHAIVLSQVLMVLLHW